MSDPHRDERPGTPPPPPAGPTPIDRAPPPPPIPDELLGPSADERRLRDLRATDIHGLPPARRGFDAGPMRTLGVVMGLGVELVATIALLGGVGFAVDALAGSGPIGLVAGLTLGVAMGFVRLVRRGLAAGKN